MKSLLETTHKGIARKIATILHLPDKEARLLEIGSVSPDSWENFPHHKDKESEIIKYIFSARKKFLNRDDECYFDLGVAFHYIQDRWTLKPRVKDKHSKWEIEINKIFNEESMGNLEDLKKYYAYLGICGKTIDSIFEPLEKYSIKSVKAYVAWLTKQQKTVESFHESLEEFEKVQKQNFERNKVVAEFLNSQQKMIEAYRKDLDLFDVEGLTQYIARLNMPQKAIDAYLNLFETFQAIQRNGLEAWFNGVLIDDIVYNAFFHRSLANHYEGYGKDAENFLFEMLHALYKYHISEHGRLGQRFPLKDKPLFIPSLEGFPVTVVKFALLNRPTDWSTPRLDLGISYRVCLIVARYVMAEKDGGCPPVQLCGAWSEFSNWTWPTRDEFVKQNEIYKKAHERLIAIIKDSSRIS